MERLLHALTGTGRPSWASPDPAAATSIVRFDDNTRMIGLGRHNAGTKRFEHGPGRTGLVAMVSDHSADSEQVLVDRLLTIQQNVRDALANMTVAVRG